MLLAVLLPANQLFLSLMETSFERLVRFTDPDHQSFYGEAPPIDDPTQLVGQSVFIYKGTRP